MTSSTLVGTFPTRADQLCRVEFNHFSHDDFCGS